MNTLYQAAKEQAKQFGFIVKEETNYDPQSGKAILCVKIDRIGPPAMMHCWKASAFNDHLTAGAWYFFIQWVALLQVEVAMNRI